MPQKSEVISASDCSELRAESRRKQPFPGVPPVRDLLEIAAVFALILIAVWTSQARLNAFASISAAACVVAFAVVGRWSARELGLTQPFKGAPYILLAGAVCSAAIALIAMPLHFAGPPNSLPLSRSWEYAFWALQQEFILQGIFFVRLESLLGSRRAVLTAAGLFALAHIPSPLLTLLAFLGGILFCELFRRFRNLYPIGIIHGALGLTIAASLPDHWLHHMRVGIGYLRFH